MASSSSSGRSLSSTHRRLLSAAFNGDLKLLKKLGRELEECGEVAKGFMRVKDSNDRTLLHFAAAGGRTHVCKYLTEIIKLDVNVKDDKGDTPLHIAVLEEQYLTTTYLLDHGAHPNVASHNGLTALHYAAEKGRKDQLRLLISKGAEVDAQSFKGTPLQCAAAKGIKDAVKILLEHHANPNSVVHHIYTPLMVAILSESIDCVRLLLKHGADPNIGSRGATPLIVAASEGETEIIKCLLKAGADPNATNFYDLTSIEIAAMNGNLADVMTLFPVTNQISNIPLWSCHGILDYVHSQEAKDQRKLKVKAKFLEAKAKGAEAVKINDYLTAIYWYTEALGMKPMDAAVLSNRSLCWAHLNKGGYALKDAVCCIMLREDWPKAYYRAGVAWRILREYERAVEAFGKALELDPKNKELQDAFREAMADFQAATMSDFSCLFGGGFCDEEGYYYEDDV